MSDAGPGAAGRRARPPVRGSDGERLSGTERSGDPLSVEGEPQADPDRAPARTWVPQGEPPGGCGTAARCRRQVTRGGAGFGPSGDAEGRARLFGPGLNLYPVNGLHQLSAYVWRRVGE